MALVPARENRWTHITSGAAWKCFPTPKLTVRAHCGYRHGAAFCTVISSHPDKIRQAADRPNQRCAAIGAVIGSYRKEFRLDRKPEGSASRGVLYSRQGTYKRKPAWSETKRVSEFVAPRAGLEPATPRLTAECSTIELSGNSVIRPCVAGLVYIAPTRLLWVQEYSNAVHCDSFYTIPLTSSTCAVLGQLRFTAANLSPHVVSSAMRETP